MSLKKAIFNPMSKHQQKLLTTIYESLEAIRLDFAVTTIGYNPHDPISEALNQTANAVEALEVTLNKRCTPAGSDKYLIIPQKEQTI